MEDLTGKGLEDLQAGIIRTPLSPFVTFKDDPLRVLRAVRFSARLHFVLEGGLRAAASSAEIGEALRTKVSRERVYKEVEGMMLGAGHRGGGRPYLAFFELYSLRLLDAVFPVSAMLFPLLDQLDIPSSPLPSPTPPPPSISSSSCNLVSSLPAPSALPAHIAGWEARSIRVAWQVNLLLHLRDAQIGGTGADAGRMITAPASASAFVAISVPPILGSLHSLPPSLLKLLYFSAIMLPLAGLVVGQGKRRGEFFLLLLR
ncbi:CCA tRNA nucleotidyltransferase, partial [archaeon]